MVQLSRRRDWAWCLVVVVQARQFALGWQSRPASHCTAQQSAVMCQHSMHPGLTGRWKKVRARESTPR